MKTLPFQYLERMQESTRIFPSIIFDCSSCSFNRQIDDALFVRDNVSHRRGNRERHAAF